MIRFTYDVTRTELSITAHGKNRTLIRRRLAQKASCLVEYLLMNAKNDAELLEVSMGFYNESAIARTVTIKLTAITQGITMRLKRIAKGL